MNIDFKKIGARMKEKHGSGIAIPCEGYLSDEDDPLPVIQCGRCNNKLEISLSCPYCGMYFENGEKLLEEYWRNFNEHANNK